MNTKSLRDYLAQNTERTISLREHYHRALRGIVARGEDEHLFFKAREMYQCWVSYAPYFFNSIMDAYMTLISQGASEDDLASLADNIFRVKRYFVHLLLPGAYLDVLTPIQEKIEFLNRFSRTASTVINRSTYEEPDPRILYTLKSLNQDKKILAGRLIEALSEACEYIYLGEQPVGFPAFGLDADVIPGHYTLYQDFDLNRGVREFANLGRINTITVYATEAAPPYRLYFDPMNAHLFYHRYLNSYEWLVGRPPISFLVSVYISRNGKELSAADISELTQEVLRTISIVAKDRAKMGPNELNLEYCAIQSRVIINMYQAGGKDWSISEHAVREIEQKTRVHKLQKEWQLEYDFDVAVKLIKDAIFWAQQVVLNE